MIKFTEGHEAMLHNTVKRVDKLEESLTDNEARIVMLEAFKVECIKHHIENDDKRKRLEDPVNRNTESNLLLAEAVTEINITITKLADKINTNQPIIDFLSNAGKAWTFNKSLWAVLVSLALGIVAIASAWKALG
jgi:hypothetical protein